mmetsp:Transcript_23290/g.50212  ORF Transcript_23290/g.50212 Transcript_23290/m.50212 type:complete len:246 (+) Transcript_23290:412-1149(+)
MGAARLCRLPSTHHRLRPSVCLSRPAVTCEAMVLASISALVVYLTSLTPAGFGALRAAQPVQHSAFPTARPTLHLSAARPRQFATQFEAPRLPAAAQERMWISSLWQLRARVLKSRAHRLSTGESVAVPGHQAIWLESIAAGIRIARPSMRTRVRPVSIAGRSTMIGCTRSVMGARSAFASSCRGLLPRCRWRASRGTPWPHSLSLLMTAVRAQVRRFCSPLRIGLRKRPQAAHRSAHLQSKRRT